IDGGSFGTEDLAHQRRERGHRPAQLPAEDLDELVELLVCRLCVDKDAELPIALCHHLWRVRDRGDLQACDIGAVDLTVADVENERDSTEVVGGAVVDRKVARAHELAGTRLDVTPSQIPGHRLPPLREKRSSRSAPDASTGRPAPILAVRSQYASLPTKWGSPCRTPQ